MDFEVVSNVGSDLNVASPTVIKVVGCGGGGSNAVNRMVEAEIKSVDFIALNTDLQALEKSIAKNRLAIGQKITQGLGAGGDPSIGQKAAEEDKDAIANILKGANMVFVTAGMGGGTGTGSVPVVANIAKSLGALTVGIVTTPFQWEGPQRMRLALDGIQKLREAADSVIVIPNAKIVEVFKENKSFKEQLRAADDLLRQSIEGMSTIITKHGTPNIDFADVRAAMKGQGTAIFGIGTASGENRAVEAASQAINNPMLEDTRIDGAKHFLINVCASSDFSLNELDEISNIICASADPNYDLKPGVVTDDTMDDRISVTVIATGFGNDGKSKNEEVAEENNEVQELQQPQDENTVSSDEWDKIMHPNVNQNENQENNDAFSNSSADENDVPPNKYGSFGSNATQNFDKNDINTPAALRFNRKIVFNR